MSSRPLTNERQRPWRKRASDQREVLDLHSSVMFRIACVEVGWRMIIVMHRDHDSEELADAGQSRSRAKATAAGVATLPRPRGAGMARSGVCPAAWIACSGRPGRKGPRRRHRRAVCQRQPRKGVHPPGTDPTAGSRGARGARSGRGLYRDRTIGGPGRVTALIATALRSWSAGRS
jgi:hypothetical protein